jgi:hypothetical protein
MGRNKFLYWKTDDNITTWINLLRDEAGNYAQVTVAQTDPQLRDAARAREVEFDRLANFITTLREDGKA